GVPGLREGLVRRRGHTESVDPAPADVLVFVVVLGARQHLTIGLAGRPARLADRALLVRSHLGDVGGRLGQVVRVGRRPVGDTALDVVLRFVDVDYGEVDVRLSRLRALALIGTLEQVTAEVLEAPRADDSLTGGLEALSPIGHGCRRLRGLTDSGAAIELVRVFVDDLRAVPGGEHDGVAVAVPAAEPGRAGPAGLAGLD